MEHSFAQAGFIVTIWEYCGPTAKSESLGSTLIVFVPAVVKAGQVYVKMLFAPQAPQVEPPSQLHLSWIVLPFGSVAVAVKVIDCPVTPEEGDALVTEGGEFGV